MMLRHTYPSGLIFQLSRWHSVPVVMAVAHTKQRRGQRYACCWSTSDDVTRRDRLDRPVSGGTLQLSEGNMPCIALPAFLRIVSHLEAANITALLWTAGRADFNGLLWVPYRSMTVEQRASLTVSIVEKEPPAPSTSMLHIYEATGW